MVNSYVYKLITILKILRNLIKFRFTLIAVIATIYEALGHRWINGELVCPHKHKSYVITITQYYRGKKICSLRVRTCVSCDFGY